MNMKVVMLEPGKMARITEIGKDINFDWCA